MLALNFKAKEAADNFPFFDFNPVASNDYYYTQTIPLIISPNYNHIPANGFISQLGDIGCDICERLSDETAVSRNNDLTVFYHQQQLHYNYSGADILSHLEIYDMMGRLIFNEQVNNPIDHFTIKLNAGTYHLRFISKDRSFSRVKFLAY